MRGQRTKSQIIKKLNLHAYAFQYTKQQGGKRLKNFSSLSVITRRRWYKTTLSERYEAELKHHSISKFEINKNIILDTQ